MGYKRTTHTIYAVAWPEINVLKVGYSENQRWRPFLLRGGEVVQLSEFDDVVSAFSFESVCHRALRRICRTAFESATPAVPFLGAAGGGWSECYRIPGDLTGRELLELCNIELDLTAV